MKLNVLLLLFGFSNAFAPATIPSRKPIMLRETKEDLKELAKKLNPLIGYYDPLNLADWNFWGVSEEARIGFLRHSEIKHGRIAMFAFVGYIAHANAVKFPWSMQLDGTKFPDELNPPLLWDKLSDNAKWQILIFIGFLEYWGELSTPNHTHYMASGGKPGKYPDFVTSSTSLPHPIWLNLYDPLRLWKNKSEEEKTKGLLIEINNGRAAMFGIMGFLSSQVVPGSIPLLNRVLPGYSGEIMNPFEFHGVH